VIIGGGFGSLCAAQALKSAPVDVTLTLIGRAKAVANVFGVHISGLLAWIVWAFIHLAYIVEFQSRILVFIQWAIQDLTFSRGTRLIPQNALTDFNFDKEIAAHAARRQVKTIRRK
jgi:NADH dehydrogenase